MRNILEQQGVQIFEQAHVNRVDDKGAYTQYHSIRAQHIVICVDKIFTSVLIYVQDDVYHAQTFLAVSKPLSDGEIKQLFPEQKLMVWDTDLIYQYFRIIKDNRFLIGGGKLIDTYALQENHHPTSVLKKLSRYAHRLFPQVKFEFEYFWPGLIGISKNLVPIAGQHPQYKNIYFATTAEGLPWATALGDYLAHKIVDGRSDFDEVFTPNRKYHISGTLQHILGKRLTFALSNGIVELLD